MTLTILTYREAGSVLCGLDRWSLGLLGEGLASPSGYQSKEARKKQEGGKNITIIE